MKETCETDSCFWSSDTGAECIEDPDTVESHNPSVSAIVSESGPECFPNFKIGALCGTHPELEGAMRCDDTCSNIVCDHHPLDV